MKGRFEGQILETERLSHLKPLNSTTPGVPPHYHSQVLSIDLHDRPGTTKAFLQGAISYPLWVIVSEPCLSTPPFHRKAENVDFLKGKPRDPC